VTIVLIGLSFAPTAKERQLCSDAVDTTLTPKSNWSALSSLSNNCAAAEFGPNGAA
jgi:hypothetical protein